MVELTEQHSPNLCYLTIFIRSQQVDPVAEWTNPINFNLRIEHNVEQG